MSRVTHLTARARAVAASTVICAFLAVASSAHATAPTLVSPVADARVAGSMPTLSWSLNGAYEKLEVEVSSGNAYDSQGYFATTVLGGWTEGADTSVVTPSDKRIWAGRWYWHVASFLPGAAAEFSDTASFVIPPRVRAPRIAGRVNAYGVSRGSIAINANGQFARIRLRGTVAGRSCINQTVGGEQQRTRLGRWYVGGAFYCRTKAKLPPGSIVRVHATLMSAGITRSSSRTFRTPGGATSAG